KSNVQVANSTTASTTTVTTNVAIGQPIAALNSFVASTITVAVGQGVDLTLVGTNTGTGSASNGGHLDISFRQLMGSGDASQTTLGSATNGETYAEYAAGSTIVNASGSLITASYLLTEYSRPNWPSGEQNTFKVHWVPTAPGTYTVEGKVALQV